MSDRIRGHVQTLVASAARTATGNSGQLTLDVYADEILFFLNITAVSGTAPTLDLYVQTSPDGGTTWIDFLHYQQEAATTERWYQWSAHSVGNASKVDVITGDGVLSSGVVVNGPIVTGAVRVKWVIGGTTPSFTFSLTAIEDGP